MLKWCGTESGGNCLLSSSSSESSSMIAAFTDLRFGVSRRGAGLGLAAEDASLIGSEFFNRELRRNGDDFRDSAALGLGD